MTSILEINKNWYTQPEIFLNNTPPTCYKPSFVDVETSMNDSVLHQSIDSMSFTNVSYGKALKNLSDRLWAQEWRITQNKKVQIKTCLSEWTLAGLTEKRLSDTDF